MSKRLILRRWGGLGDVCMALAAAHAAEFSGRWSSVGFITHPDFHPLVQACPWVEPCGAAGPGDEMVDLSDAAFGLSPKHQVDSYLDVLRVNARSSEKSLDLIVPDLDSDFVESLLPPGCPPSVVLHAGRTDPNRTWPAESWRLLALQLQGLGWQVIFVGSPSTPDGRGVHAIDPLPAWGVNPASIDLVGKLNLLQLVALFRMTGAMVSADSGPIQLAGASETGIVGLYSVVPGARRLPFRHGDPFWRSVAVMPTCGRFPCYNDARDVNRWVEHSHDLQAAGFHHLGQILGNWCPAHPIDAPSRFACMRSQVTVQRVAEAVSSIFCEVER